MWQQRIWGCDSSQRSLARPGGAALNRRWIFVVVASLAAGALVAAGCGDDEDAAPTPTPNPQVLLCSKIDDLEAALDDLSGVDSSTAVSELQKEVDNVELALAEVRSAASTVAIEQAKTDTLRSSVEFMKSTINDLPPEGLVGEEFADIPLLVLAVRRALKDVAIASGCN